MTIDELAARDAAERYEIRTKAIAHLEHAIAQRRAQRALTTSLERQLAVLQAALLQS